MEIWTIKRPLTGLVRPCTMTVEGYPFRWIKDIARMLSPEKDCALKMLNCPCLCSPPYLPCVSPQIFVTFIYIHPREKADEASVLTRQVTQRLIYISWHSIWVLADFNYCSLKKTWSDLHQYVTCLIRLKNTLGLCYGSVKGAHKALQLPLREGADPNIQLIPFISNYPKEGKKPSSNRLRSGVMTPSWASGCCDCTPPWYLLGALFCLWWSCWCCQLSGFLLCGQCNPN